MTFTHLHVQSAYSLLNSTCRIDQLVKKAAELGFKSLALTDHNVMYGAIPFYKTCQQYGIKPIIGLELSVLSQTEPNAVYSLLLYAKNNQGYLDLIQLASLVNGKYMSGIPLAILEQYHAHLFVVSPFRGEFNQCLLRDELEKAKQVVTSLQAMFQDHFFVAYEYHGHPSEKTVNQAIRTLSKDLEFKTVVSNDVHYLEPEESFAYECLLAIKNGTKLNRDAKQGAHFLKPSQDMFGAFKHVPEALRNTETIASECHMSLAFGHISVPKYPVPAQQTAHEYLRDLCQRGLKQRYQPSDAVAMARLEYELEVIQAMNFSDYFLIVWDFMKYARTHDILTGPGRGSAAGSLVAYVLDITKVDPIEHGLLFERFLNPGRVTMPDIDIDFPDIHRDKVIQYVAQKYGHDHVAQIITFGTLAARASIRDVGRVMGLDLQDVDKIAKTIPARPGVTLKQAYEESAQLKKLLAQSDEFKELFAVASKIEGLPRHTSKHAAGVIISDAPLTNTVPTQQGQDGLLLTQYPMGVLEDLGLLKMDFLGLRNLTVMQNITALIKSKTGKKLSLNHIPLDDQRTYELLASGDTSGVFQLESEGMRRVLQQLKPTEFEDIVAVNALFRPGPMDYIPTYMNRKHGKEKVIYPHEDLREILAKTYGVIVYQEQIMQIAAKLAGFSLGEADILRRAVSKKKKEVLDEERKHFVAGCLNQGYEAHTANEIYDFIVRFANYGFNRSHAVAYSRIAYELAYLKANYPLFFIAAILTSVTGNDEKQAEYIHEAKRKKMTILPPSINHSQSVFTVEESGIRYSLAAIKNIGMAVTREVLRERKRGPFKDLFDFCVRMPKKVMSRKILESFILSGCFDDSGRDRASLLASIEVALEYVDIVGEPDQGFLLGEDIIPKPQYVEVSPLEPLEKLNFEKEVLGLFLSQHPVQSYASVLQANKANEIADIYAMKRKTHAQVGGYVLDQKIIKTKKEETMAFITISDHTGEIDAVIFPKQYQMYSLLLQKENLLYLTGIVDIRNDKKQFVINEAIPLKRLKRQTEQVLYIRINGEEESNNQILVKVKQILKNHIGQANVVLYYSASKRTIRLNGVDPSQECLAQLSSLLGDQNVVLQQVAN